MFHIRSSSLLRTVYNMLTMMMSMLLVIIMMTIEIAITMWATMLLIKICCHGRWVPTQLTITGSVNYKLRTEDVICCTCICWGRLLLLHVKLLLIIVAMRLMLIIIIISTVSLLCLGQMVRLIHCVLIWLFLSICNCNRLIYFSCFKGWIRYLIIGSILLVLLSYLRRRLRCWLVLSDSTLSHNSLLMLLIRYDILIRCDTTAPHKVNLAT